MRKSLLITSALGLVSALPTFAMASAAGSSAASCASGFFAQIDAKIMNAKLEIKNEKNTKLPDLQDETDDGIEKKVKSDLIATLQNPDFEVFFKGKFGGTAAQKENLIAAVEGYNLSQIKTDAAFLALVKTDAAFIPAMQAVPNSEAELLRFVQTVRSLATEAKLPDATTLGDVVTNYAAATGKVVEISYQRIAGNTYDDVALTVDANEVTAEGTRFTSAKFYINDLDESDFDTAKMKAALQERFKDQVDFIDKINNYKTPALVALVSTIKNKAVAFNTEIKREKDAGYDVTDRRVHNHALAGGVGVTAGWWQNMGGFAVSVSGTGEYLWGTFRTMDDASGSSMTADQKKKLGFGFQGDVGVHCVVSPSTTLGVLVGLRGQQLQFGRTDKTAKTTNSKDSRGDYASKWMLNPVVSAQARTFFTDTVYGSLTVGYVIPMSEKDYKLENTNIANKDAKVRFQGLTGAFSVGMMF